jgi:hypothetical protein
MGAPHLIKIITVLKTKKDTFYPIKNPLFFEKLVNSNVLYHSVRFGTKFAG